MPFEVVVDGHSSSQLVVMSRDEVALNIIKFIMRNWIPLSFLFLLLIALLAVDGTNASSAIEQKRQEILARRESQKKRLNAMMLHLRKQLADHSAGEKVLDPEEKKAIERRLSLYVQKVKSMKDYVDDEEVETTMAREESQRAYRTNHVQRIIEEAKKEMEEERNRAEGQGGRGGEEL
eukprot:scaffold672_cov126-Cylindrotheca_fusiformis.AAC.54